jgi:hypothetical protein
MELLKAYWGISVALSLLAFVVFNWGAGALAAGRQRHPQDSPSWTRRARSVPLIITRVHRFGVAAGRQWNGPTRGRNPSAPAGRESGVGHSSPDPLRIYP